MILSFGLKRSKSLRRLSLIDLGFPDRRLDLSVVMGSHVLLPGLMALTLLATCFVPTAALVVLMAPIVLNTSTNMGLSKNSP